MSSSPDGAESNTSEDTEGVEDAMTSADESTGGPASFGLLAIAFLVLAGGAVYFFGAVLSADDETLDAQPESGASRRHFNLTQLLRQRHCISRGWAMESLMIAAALRAACP